MIRNDNKGEKVMSFIDLNSVGSTLTEDLLVFPQDISEAPTTASEAEEMLGVHIYDLDNEWFASMSAEDLKAFFKFVEKHTYEILAGPFSMWKTQIWGEWEEMNNCYMNLEVA